MSKAIAWGRDELLVALSLYCRLPFGKLHSKNPEVIRAAKSLGRTPSALAMKLTNIASLDPAITSNGRVGLKGASALDRSMWSEMQSDWENFAAEAQEVSERLGISEEAPAPAIDLPAPADYTGLDRDSITKVRVGQSFFRRAVLSAYGYRCCVSGLCIPELLIASHIVPWKSEVTARLDPRNGLCLSALHDRAFDLGIMTVSEQFTVQISNRYRDSSEFSSKALFSYDGAPIRMPEKFEPLSNYLAYHRNNIFEKKVA